MKLPRVLLIAEAANPDWVSVPLIGASLAEALREVADVHLVTQIRNRDALLAAGWIEGTDVTFIDSEAIARPAWKLAELLRLGKGAGWTMVTAIGSLTYGYFERKVWRHFEDDLKAGRFDLVHRIVPLSPTANSPLAARCARIGIPFILGPLNGGVPWPPGFERERLREREFLSYLRGVYRLLPGRKSMLDSAAAIICGSRHTQSEVENGRSPRVRWLPENAIDPARFSRIAVPAQAGAPLKAVFIGRLVPYKGADMAIEAAAPFIAAGRMSLDIVGDGPQMESLIAQAAALKIENGVTFHGWQQHRAVQDIASACQLLLFPSVREFGGGVVLEAMALGLVPLIVDYGGPGELVESTTGLKVPLGDRASIVSSLQDALDRVTSSPEALMAMAQAARSKVMQDFTWSAKARQISTVYDAVLRGEPLPHPLNMAG